MIYKSLNSKVRNHLEAKAKGLAFYPSFKWKESQIMELHAQPRPLQWNQTYGRMTGFYSFLLIFFSILSCNN